MIYEMTDRAILIFRELLKLQKLYYPDGPPQWQFDEYHSGIKAQCRVIDGVSDEMPISWQAAIIEAKQKQAKGIPIKEIVSNI